MSLSYRNECKGVPRISPRGRGGAAHISFEEEGMGKTDIISYKIKQKTN